jgi:6-phosphofructokinase 1
MGRDTGWIALFAGVAGTADVILIPEIPYDLDIVCEKLDERYVDGPEFAIVVVAEGAYEKGTQPHYKAVKKPGQASRLGGVAELLAEQINERTGHETRSLVLGHLQRGGAPIAYDRLLALRFGAAAVQLVADGNFGCMVALNPPRVEAVPLEDAISRIKAVPVDGDVVTTARALGVSFGDDRS